jgi:hypothetical protein
MKYDIHVLPDKLLRLRIRQNEINSSGNRPDVRIRGQFEYFEVLNNYKILTDPEELIRVFPVIKKYIKPEGFDLGFALGMAAIESDTYNFTKLFGLHNLFEAINEPVRASRIRELYGFGNIDFIALTAQHDVFSAETQYRFNAIVKQMEEKDAQIQGLSQALTEIQNSRAWKLITTYRNIRAKLPL